KLPDKLDPVAAKAGENILPELGGIGTEGRIATQVEVESADEGRAAKGTIGGVEIGSLGIDEVLGKRGAIVGIGEVRTNRPGRGGAQRLCLGQPYVTRPKGTSLHIGGAIIKYHVHS